MGGRAYYSARHGVRYMGHLGSSHPSSAGGIEVVNPRQLFEWEIARRVASRIVAVSTMSVQGDWELEHSSTYSTRSRLD